MSNNVNETKNYDAKALAAEIEKLRAENAALKANRSKGNGKRSLKVSAKGAISVYGLARFPVTLYREQFEKLLAMADEIKAFIKANESKLTVKGQVKPEVAAA